MHNSESVQVTPKITAKTSTSTQLPSTSTMASSTTQWEAPKFSFNIPDQAAEWKQFYTRAIYFLEALGIDSNKEDVTNWGWHQIKMMFQGEDWQAFQTLLDNNRLTSEHGCTPSHALNVIETYIKEDEHFWHFRDQLFK